MSHCSDLSLSLIDTLKQVEDFRTARGKRYPLWLDLLLVILGMISQCQGYCSLEAFASRHKDALIQALGLSLKRLASDSTFRLILQQLDDARLLEVWSGALNRWQSDCRHISGTQSDPAELDECGLALLPTARRGLKPKRLRTSTRANSKECNMLLKAVHLQGSASRGEGNIVTLDALQAQKKPVETILKRGNDFVIALLRHFLGRYSKRCCGCDSIESSPKLDSSPTQSQSHHHTRCPGPPLCGQVRASVDGYSQRHLH